MTLCPHKLSLLLLLFELVPATDLCASLGVTAGRRGMLHAFPSHLLATICIPTFIFCSVCLSALTTVTPNMIVIYA